MTTYRNFHEGEAELQARAGVDTPVFDLMVDQAFRPSLSPTEARFIEGRTFSVAATIDAQRRPWASPLVGHPGELFAVVDDLTIVICPRVAEGDPLIDAVAATGEMGVLYFEPQRRRRSKSTGQARLIDSGSIIYEMRRHFGLCTKYIFVRDHDTTVARSSAPVTPRFASRLGLDDRSQLATSDTIFLASFHSDHGADPTHRGGPPGFVHVVDDATVTIPDYTGNGMFQTLGNLRLDDRVGLMAIDFPTGRTIQLTGRGAVVESRELGLGSERYLRIAIEEVRTTWRDIGHWTDRESFDFRPGLRNPATPYR